jgi:glucosylceramidase
VLALVVVWMVPAGASAAGTPPVLSAAERQAITVKSITASADPSLGLVAVVTFRGDVARYLGQGALADGAVALLLSPQSKAPTGALIGGGGFSSVPLPTPVRPAVLDAFARERAFASGVTGGLTVIRAGTRLIIRLPGAAANAATRLTVRTFVRGVSGRLTAAVWSRVLHAAPASTKSVNLSPQALSARQLAALGGPLSAASTQLQRSRSAVRSAQRALAAAARPSRQQIAAAAASNARLTARINDLGTLDDVIGQLLAATRAPAVSVVQTDTGLSQGMTSLAPLAMTTIRPAAVPTIDIDPAVRYQRFAGVGAAMTDSAAWLIEDALSPQARQALLQELFGAAGQHSPLGIPDLGLNFLRVGIGASGAMTVGAPYSYDDTPAPDPSLQQFSIAPDQATLVPALQQALAVNPSLRILGSLWSAPAWMKTNGSLDNLGGAGSLLPSDDGPLAQYFVRFIEAYAAAGIPVDAVTPANEPAVATFGTDYPGMTLPESAEAQFIAQNLAPALRAADLPTAIYGHDDSWNGLPYATALATGPAAAALSGIAWHCYFGSPAAMSTLQQTAPALDQIVDECSPEIRSFGTPEFLISSLRNWASTVAVWTAALDPTGGPIQLGNNCPGCTGPVTIDEQTQTATLRPEYYQLGQVSAFVEPGATRIASTNFVQYGVNAAPVETVTQGLDDVTFQNPDGSEVLVAYNHSAAPLSFAVAANGGYFTDTIPARAMTTFRFTAGGVSTPYELSRSRP